MNRNKILFIINPVSGHGKQKKVKKYITKYLDKRRFESEIAYTERPGHASEISLSARDEFDYVVAVGGDGSINEVSRGLINSNVTMGILPFGSGNGLARYLHIPLHPTKAIELLNSQAKRNIDTFLVNGREAVNVAGIGFDAHISHKFAEAGTRGFSTYVKLSVGEFFKFKPKQYELTIDGRKHVTEAFVVSFANSSQFGNNAHIAPKAQIDDGLLDVVVLKPFPVASTLNIGSLLFTRQLHRSPYFESFRCSKIRIVSDEALLTHIDGDPYSFGKELEVKMNPRSLSVIAP